MVICCLIGTGTVLIVKKYGTLLVYLVEIQQAEYGPWGPTIPEFTADFPGSRRAAWQI